MNRSLHMCVVALVIFVFSGCTAEKKRLETELSAARATIDALQSDLVAARENANRTLNDSVSTYQGALHAAAATIDSLFTKNAALRGELKSAKAQYEKSLADMTRQHEDAEAKLTFVEHERDSLVIRVDELGQSQASLQTKLTDNTRYLQETVIPWYRYKSHEAGRSWWQHTWGTGHAKQPDGPEPNFTAL